MIVSDDDMHVVVEIFNDTWSEAEAEFIVTTEKNNVERVYSELFLSHIGTVPEKQARTIISPVYQAALKKQAEAKKEFVHQRAERDRAENLRDIWKAELYRATALEKIR